MEIIHLILGKANPQRMNGVNKVVYQLATQQALAGKAVSVWGITRNLAHDYGDRNFNTLLFPAMRNPFVVHESLRESIIEQKGRAIFHLHGGWLPVYATIAKLLAKHQIPFVFTPHGAYNTVAMQRNKWQKKLYFYFFEKQLLQKAHKIHCIGESEVVGLQKIFPNEKSFLLPYGFETAKNTLPAPKSISQSFIIGFVGRLDIYTKGLDILVDAFAQFRQKVPQAKLWIVGDSHEKEALEKLIDKANIQESVILWGAKFGEEKERLIKQMSVFVHPSRNEGLPASVLEACSFGIPCIVSKETNVGNYIENYQSGKVLAENKMENLATVFQEMEKMSQTPQFQSLRENAFRMVREAFDWQNIVQKFDELYGGMSFETTTYKKQ